MTNRDAIETIKANWPSENYTLLREAFDLALKALDRETPSTMRWIKMTGMMPPEYHGHYECSCCGWHGKTYGEIETNFKYCPNCGREAVK